MKSLPLFCIRLAESICGQGEVEKNNGSEQRIKRNCKKIISSDSLFRVCAIAKGNKSEIKRGAIRKITMINKTVKRYPLSKQVADKLEQMIETGEYQVGKRIPTETELMEIFQVSRNTLREAIRALTSAGVLEVKQGDGTYVRSNNRFNANMSMKYAQVSLEDIRETRNSLELTIVKLASRRRTDEDMELITDKYLKRQGLKQDEKENTMADMEFHLAIANACHNQILIDLYQSIASYLENHIAARQAETDMDCAEIDVLHEKLYLAVRDQKENIAVACARNILKI